MMSRIIFRHMNKIASDCFHLKIKCAHMPKLNFSCMIYEKRWYFTHYNNVSLTNWFSKLHYRSHSSWVNHKKRNNCGTNMRKSDGKISVQDIFNDRNVTMNRKTVAAYDSGKRKTEHYKEASDSEKHHQKPSAIAELYNQLQADGRCRYISSTEWKDYDRYIQEHAKELSNSWPVRLADYISLQEKRDGTLELGESILDFIKIKSDKVTPLLTDVIRMQLLVNQDQSEHQIFDIYDQICQRYRFLDASSLSKIIPVLCQTSRWKECINLLDMFSLTAQISTLQYSPVVVAAIQNNAKETAYNLMDIMSIKDLIPMDTVYNEFLRSSVDMDAVDKFLMFIRKRAWFVSEDVAGAIQNWFESCTSETWKGERIVIKKHPKCPRCKEMIEAIDNISDETFVELRDKFLERSLMKKDIFQNTSPDELKSFTDMLKHCGPFDVVIDGLNTAHGTVQKASVKEKADVLHDVVNFFAVGRKKKVLMLGRGHMQTWPKQSMDKISQKAECFYTSNSSQDDPFMLYAALVSGPDTLFVTRDQLRDHRILLGDRLAQSFKHWQLSRQVPFRGRYPDKQGKLYLSFKWPNKYHTRVHQTAHGWHIPYDDGKLRASYEVPNTWLCLLKSVTSTDS